MSESSSSKLVSVPEAPVFSPTEEEFADPLAYIASIRPQAELYGACKIRPPPGFKPDFALNKRTFRFKTRVQCVHELQERNSSQETFSANYELWLASQGKANRGYPVIYGQEVDLWRLYRLVTRRGGYEEVTNGGKGAWRDIARSLQVTFTLC